MGPGALVDFWRRKNLFVDEIRTPDHAAPNVGIFSGKYLGYLYSFTVGRIFDVRNRRKSGWEIPNRKQAPYRIVH